MKICDKSDSIVRRFKKRSVLLFILEKKIKVRFRLLSQVNVSVLKFRIMNTYYEISRFYNKISKIVISLKKVITI